MQISSASTNEDYIIPLDELKLLKEGLSDPSPQLIVLFTKVLGSRVIEAEINAHLIEPFEEASGLSTGEKQ